MNGNSLIAIQFGEVKSTRLKVISYEWYFIDSNTM